MPSRILRDWTDSLKFDGLSADAERLFLRILMKADDFGRFHADPRLIRSGCFPLLEAVRAEQVDRWLNELSTRRLLFRYEVRGQAFLSVINFRQRLKQSIPKFPPPDGKDRNWLPDDSDFREVPGSSSLDESDTNTSHLSEKSANPEVPGSSRKFPEVPASSLLSLDASLTLEATLEGSPSGKFPEPPGRSAASPPSAAALVESWNRNRGELPAVSVLSDGRARHAKVRLKAIPDIARWEKAIQRLSTSRFALGGGSQGWRADFDWLLKPDSLARIEEGKYDNQDARPGPKAPPSRHGDGAELHVVSQGADMFFPEES